MPTPQAAAGQPIPQPAPEVPAEPVVSLDVSDAGRAGAADEGEVEPEVVAGRQWRWSRRRVIAAAAVVVLAAAGGLTWWLLAGSDQSAPVAGRTIVVQNKVAFGPTDLEEDRSPSYLAGRPIERCANVPGCKLAGTDLGSVTPSRRCVSCRARC